MSQSKQGNISFVILSIEFTLPASILIHSKYFIRKRNHIISISLISSEYKDKPGTATYVSNIVFNLLMIKDV